MEIRGVDKDLDEHQLMIEVIKYLNKHHNESPMAYDGIKVVDRDLRWDIIDNFLTKGDPDNKRFVIDLTDTIWTGLSYQTFHHFLKFGINWNNIPLYEESVIFYKREDEFYPLLLRENLYT